MSSATAFMQVSGSMVAPSSSAAHSAHRHRSPGESARRRRDGFISDTLRGGSDFCGPAGFAGFGVLAGDAEVPLDRAQPLVDLLQPRLDRTGRLPPDLRTTKSLNVRWPAEDGPVVVGLGLQFCDHLI